MTSRANLSECLWDMAADTFWVLIFESSVGFNIDRLPCFRLMQRVVCPRNYLI